ncbi:hypothetical protein ABT160_33330 [Streptomyces sp. NPDC001941]|uniref:hypothetical protein n=1 Tax=Streptomyces sp. NPDC001941 TaxID=3154659 RepID=UPI00332E39A0
MTDTETIIGNILDDCLDDWIPVDRVIGYAEIAAEEDGGDSRALFEVLLGSLLQRGLATVGYIGDSGFEPWELSPDDSLKRAVRECAAVGWEPLMGGPWVASTPEGDRQTEARQATS